MRYTYFTGREIIHSELKREVARKAIALISEGDVVALNSGTTNTVLAQELVGPFTVVTNNYAALRVVAVMDSSKLGQCSKCMALSPEQVDLLLMDDHIPPK